jgi:hypothetical protein
MPVLAQSQQKPTQYTNSDGSIGSDSSGSLSEPNIVFASFDLEGYLLAGGGFQAGGFYDSSTRNFGLSLFKATVSGPNRGCSNVRNTQRRHTIFCQAIYFLGSRLRNIYCEWRNV